MNTQFETILKLAEITIIKRDFDVLKKLVLQLNAEHQIYLTQYTALFCYEVIEYLNNNGYDVNIEQTSKYSIKDIRMKTKFFDFSIKKLFQCVENVDALQHAEFINQMAFPQLGKWNIHYNLGIFFDDEKRIVGNSHYGYYLFQDEKMISKTKEELTGVKVLGEEIRDFAYDMGRIIGSISDGLSQISDFIVSDVYTQNIVSHSQDFNTNRCFGKINEQHKIIRLFLLHVLSNIGFLLYVLKKVIIRDCGLLLRFEYISFHYTIQRMEELLKYSEKNNFFDDKKLRIMFNNINLLSINNYRKSEFRNCMMHFGLKNTDDVPLIQEGEINLSVPFCGLVESQFDMCYDEFKSIIEEQLSSIYDEINTYLNFDLFIPKNE